MKNFLIIYSGYSRGIIIGMSVVLLSALAFSSFQVMGVDLSEFTDFLLSQYFWILSESFLRILLFSVCFFGVLGYLVHIDAKNHKGSYILEWWIIAIILILAWIHSAVQYPQLYSQVFNERFTGIQFIAFFLTDFIPPLLPYLVILMILLGMIGHILMKYWMTGDRECGFLLLSYLAFYSIHISGNFYLLVTFFGILPWIRYYSKSFSLSVMNGILGILFLLAIILNLRGLYYEYFPIHYESDKTPVIWIAGDSLRTDTLGFVSGDRTVTPSLDSLVRDSIYYSDHHVSIPRTFPSWADMLTGRPSVSHGIFSMFPDKESSLSLDRNSIPTLPNLLNSNGYHSFVVGNFAADIFPRARFGFQRTITPSFNAKILIMHKLLESQVFLLPILTGSVAGGGEYLSEVLSLPNLGDGMRILPKFFQEMSQSDGKGIFSVYFSSVAHFPYAPPYPHYKKYTNINYYGKYKYSKYVDPTDSSRPRDGDIEQIRGLYKSSVHAFDHELGRILEYLKRNNLYDRSLILLTSDHGESLYESDHGQGHGEHLRGNHTLQVPLIVKLPQGFQFEDYDSLRGGSEISNITSSLDIYPSIVEILSRNGSISKYPNPDQMFGESILSMYKDNSIHSIEGTRYVYSETGVWFSDRGDHFFQKKRIPYPNILELHSIDSEDGNQIRIDNPYFKKKIFLSKHRAVTSSDYKLIYIPTREGVGYEFYNRKVDPLNEVNLIEDTKYSVEIARMKKWLFRFLLDEGNLRKIGDYLLPKS